MSEEPRGPSGPLALCESPESGQPAPVERAAEDPINENRISILAIDDNPSDLDLLRRYLKEARGIRVEFAGFTSFSSARAALAARRPDVVILDYLLGVDTGLEVLAAVRRAGNDTPIIVLTGRGDEQVAADSIKAGADDYLSKEQMDSGALKRSIRYVLRRQQARREAEKARLLEHHLAYQDGLTGLVNRWLFLDRLDHQIARGRRYGHLVAVLFIDLDRFKRVNDTLGHATGDLLLQAVAGRLESCVRECDTVGRLGGDEFVVALGELRDKQDAAVVAQKILDAMSQAVPTGGQQLLVTVSMGISVYPFDGADGGELLRNADAAMYRAKKQGGNSFEFYQPSMRAQPLDRAQIVAAQRGAIERGELLAYYQPQIDASSGAIVGLEALLRWRHQQLGILTPRDFLPVAEETGLIRAMEDWILRAACAQAKAWQDARYGFPRVSVNLSARHIGRTNLLRSVFCALRESQLNPQSLAIEITESSARLDASRAPTLQWLKAMGVQIVLDDFGTSYSSPSQLKSFPIDMIKMDRSFVDNIVGASGPLARSATSEPLVATSVAITSAIITMAHSLEVKAGAKGVESADQHHLLRSLGCDEVQGFLFSRPLPADEATRLLADGAALVGASGPLAPSGTSEPLVPTGSRASALAEEGAHGGS